MAGGWLFLLVCFITKDFELDDLLLLGIILLYIAVVSVYATEMDEILQ